MLSAIKQDTRDERGVERGYRFEKKSFADGRDRNIVVWNGLQWM
jgi:hypothetical protein